MSWLPHPSTWGKKNTKPSSPLIMTVPEGTVEVLRSMGVELKEDKEPFPLFEIKCTLAPYPRPIGALYAMKFEYNAKKEIDAIDGKQEKPK